MEANIMIAVVEDYIFERKQKKVKIRHPQSMVELIQLTEAYQYVLNYRNNEK